MNKPSSLVNSLKNLEEYDSNDLSNIDDGNNDLLQPTNDENEHWIIRCVNRIKRSLGYEISDSKLKAKLNKTKENGKSTPNKKKIKKKEKLAAAFNNTRNIEIRKTINRRQTE